MGLSARDRQALHSIERSLADNDPHFASKLASFTRLAEGRDMPQAERRRVGGQNGVVSSILRWLRGSRRQAHAGPRSRRGQALMVLWLVVACALIATAAALSHYAPGGQCAALAPVHCSGPPPASPRQHSAR